MTLEPTAPQAALPPDCAMKFAVEGLVASGGFGIVYRARQIALSRGRGYLYTMVCFYHDTIPPKEGHPVWPHTK